MNLLAKHHHKILWILIILYIIIFSSVCLWKYYNFGYNSLDLAIINQVFDNTLQGQFFASSIHDPSYLGDHFTPILFLLLPFYFLNQSPITLLILQTIFLALAAWPLYLIAKNVFTNPKYYLIFPLIFLLNPFIHNINVFEFHFLPLGFFLIFFAFYFYQKNKFGPFTIFIILSLLIREDVSFFIFCFGLFILIDKLINKKKIKWQWVLTPIILSAIYLFISLKITAHFSPNDNYKFLIYYSWLGDSLPEVAKNFFIHPLQVLTHILRTKNLEMILALFLPFAFIPLIKPRYLILALGTFLQLTISDIGASVLIVQLHYVTLLAIPLFLASAYALEYLTKQSQFKSYRGLIVFILIVATIYSAFTLGFGKPQINRPELISIKEEFQQKIPATASVVTTYEFLPFFSAQPRLYSLNYVFLGQKQLSRTPYTLPDNTEYLLANLDELITYQMQYQGLSFYHNNYFQGSANLRQMLADNNFGLVEIQDTVALFQKNTSVTQPLYTIKTKKPADFFACQPLSFSPNEQLDTHFACQVQFAETVTENYQLELEIKKGDEIIYSRLLPIAYGFYTTSELTSQERLTTAYHLKTNQTNYDSLCFNLVQLKGALALNKMGSTYNYLEEKKVISSNCF